MRVRPSQLIAGSVLLRDVKGKSGRPIMKENTVLTDEHITVLHKFLIDWVDISSKLANGKIFNPTETKKEDKPARKEEAKEIYLEAEESRSFPQHYLEVVETSKQNFRDWSNGVPIDLAKVRRTLIPLLERLEELDMEMYTLHQHTPAEDYIYHHSVAVGLISAFLGKESGYRKGEWIQIGLAGYLSDVGMARVDPEMLNKVGPLTESQLQDIRNHSTYSYRMVEKLTGLSQSAKLGILQHHERVDGSGYPLGLTKDKINPYARIIAIADAYHAMTSERLYKDKQRIFRVVDEILQSQYTKLDTDYVRTFTKSLSDRALGKTVHLTNNETGEIVFLDEDHPTRPLVRLHKNEEVISLQMNPEVKIKDIILD